LTDPFNLTRFIEAQAPVYDSVVHELAAGQKTGHWMWFIFPQLKGLGHSAMSQKYAISSQAEAEAYLNHPILGLRLLECTRLVRRTQLVFDYPDNLKFKSSMELFAAAAKSIEKYDGEFIVEQELRKPRKQ
jgi:uncharacterized protein (DUF1810 family)